MDLKLPDGLEPTESSDGPKPTAVAEPSDGSELTDVA